MKNPWEKTWKIIEKLGEGGQAITHKVQSISNPSNLGAMKVLKGTSKPQARQRMAIEVASLKALNTAEGGVPAVLEHNTEQSDDVDIRLYVVMNLIVGDTLKQLIERDGRLQLDIAIGFTIRLCTIVKYAHNAGVLHRDIKPDNIIVRDIETYDLVIVDYGISFNKLFDTEITRTSDGFRNNFLDLGETSVPGGNQRDERSDITAICAILYFCLTGTKPVHLVDGDGKLPHQRPNSGIDSLGIDSAKASTLHEFFDRAFQPLVDNRFQSIDEVAEELTAINCGDQASEDKDPVKLASKWSTRLLLQDRNTQLAVLKQRSEPLLVKLENLIKTYSEKNLAPFAVGRIHIHDVARPPQDYDLVVGDTIPILMRVDNHYFAMIRKYAICASGMKCVLISGTRFVPDTRKMKNYSINLDEEIVWFEASPDHLIPQVENNFKRWINKSMDDIGREILHVNATNSSSRLDGA